MSTRREFIKQVAVASAAFAIGDKLNAMDKRMPKVAPSRVLGAMAAAGERVFLETEI